MSECTIPLRPELPRLRLDFYTTALLMSRWEADGRLVSYPISVDDLACACTEVRLGSGLLPPEALFWKRQANVTTLGIFIPARRWQVQTMERTYHIPMPPFIFIGKGKAYQVFAVKQRPRSERDRLYHAPCPNVDDTGDICQGDVPFPLCSFQTVFTAFRLFMEDSLFNSHHSREKCHSQKEDVRRLWAELDGHKRFPLSELVPAPVQLRNLL